MKRSIARLLVFSAVLAFGARIHAVDSTRSDTGLFHANQTVTDNGLAVDAKSGGGLKKVSSAAVFGDIAFSAARPVRFTGAELIISNVTGTAGAIVVLDSKGRVVLSKSFSGGTSILSLSTKSLPPGVYVYTARVAGSASSKSFIKPR